MGYPSVLLMPVTGNRRIPSLDVLRGVAVIGILFVNIVGFGLLFNINVSERLFANWSSAGFFSYATVYILLEGKMRALFCMLFGAGILLFGINKKAASSGYSTRLFYIRMIWLVVFGLVHAYLLLWKGEVLFFYGVFGMLVYLMRNMRLRYMLLAVPFVTLVWFVVVTLYYQSMQQEKQAYDAVIQLQQQGKQLSAEQLAHISSWKKIVNGFLPSETEVKATVDRMRGSYAEVASEIRPQAFSNQTRRIPFEMGDNVALMLLGMALLKLGFFTCKWTNRQYMLSLLIGYGIGVPLVLLDLWYMLQHRSSVSALQNYIAETNIPWDSLLGPLQYIFIGIAHCSFILLLVKNGIATRVLDLFRAAGQMALSNYILQTVLCTLFFFGYGLGYYNELQFHQLYYVVIVLCIVQLALSKIWIHYFQYGPVEWLWRWLTYKQVKLVLPKWIRSRVIEVPVTK